MSHPDLLSAWVMEPVPHPAGGVRYRCAHDGQLWPCDERMARHRCQDDPLCWEGNCSLVAARARQGRPSPDLSAAGPAQAS